MIKVNYIASDDWKGLYINGKLAIEGHSIHVFDLLKTLEKRELLKFTHNEINENYLENIGAFPENFVDLDKNKLF